MREYCTEAIVLDKEEARGLDSKVFLYTRDLGKVVAKATSARKITSKLNAHLEPLNLVTVGLVNKNSFQLVDALTIERFRNWRNSSDLAVAVNLLHFIKDMTFEGGGDYTLWAVLKNALYSNKINHHFLLQALGFDPKFATCEICNKQPNYFTAEDCLFYCKNCFNSEICSSSYIQLS